MYIMYICANKTRAPIVEQYVRVINFIKWAMGDGLQMTGDGWKVMGDM
jgi:hypothetical protein